MNNLEFIEFVKAQLTDDTTAVSFETIFKNIPGWDSLTVMLLITNLKDEHAINISVSELQNCKTVGDIHVLISSK